MDPIEYAIQRYRADYNRQISVLAKSKYLRKFGRTRLASSTKTTIAIFQDAVVNETYATGNTIDKLASEDASDNGKIVVVEGHTKDSSGNYNFEAPQFITLGNQAAVDLTVPLFRQTRMYCPAGNLVGRVTGFDSSVGTGTLTSGKPDEDTAVKCVIEAGKQQSEKGATAISYKDAWLIDNLLVSVARGSPQAAIVDIDVEIALSTGGFLPAGLEITLNSDNQNCVPVRLKDPIIVPQNSDVRGVATSSQSDTIVTISMAGPLALDITTD